MNENSCKMNKKIDNIDENSRKINKKQINWSNAEKRERNFIIGNLIQERNKYRSNRS